MICTRGLTKRYGRKVAVDRLDLDVKKGSIYGLLGVNGAGKTTLLGMLSTLIRPTSGKIEIAGRSDKNWIRDRIGLLPQDASLPSYMKVRDILEYFSKLKAGSYEEIADRLSLDLDARIGRLSHGMQKIVYFATAFLGDPELVLLDEPLAGLDPNHRKIVRDFIKDSGSTIIISTHLLEEVEILCSDVGILHEGRLIVQESAAKLKKSQNILVADISNLDKEMVHAVEKTRSVEGVLVQGNRMTVRMTKDVSSTIQKKLLSKGAEITAFEKGMSAEDIFLDTISS